METYIYIYICVQEIPIEEVVVMNANMQALGGRSELSEVCFADVQVSNGSQEFIYIYFYIQFSSYVNCMQ